MPATIRIDFDVNTSAIPKGLADMLKQMQILTEASANAAEQSESARIVKTAKKRIDEETKAARSIQDVLSAADAQLNQKRSQFSAEHYGNEKQQAKAIIEEVAKLQEQKDKIVRAMRMDGLTKDEQVILSMTKKKNDVELATIRRIALENKQIAEHGAGASVGIMGIGRNIEKNFDKAAGMARGLQGALGVVSGFTLGGLVNSANQAKEQTEAMATVLRSANVPAEQVADAVDKLKDNANAFADTMGLSRERAREVAIEIVGMTGLTGEAANQATELALTYEKATGGVMSAEKFAKLLTKSIGDPENEKALKSLEAKYPGISAKIGNAATEQEKLNILQQAASPAMAQMAENASGLYDRVGVFIGGATDKVGSFLGAHVDTIGVLGQTTATMLPLVAGFKQYAIAQKVTTAAQWLWNAAMNANPIGLVITAVAALVGGLILLYNKVEPVRKAIDGMVSWVVEAYKSFMSWIDSLGVAGKALLFIITPISAVIEGVKALGGWLSDLFGEEEKVVVSTSQVTAANIANADSAKKRAEAISEVIASLKEEKAANESTVEGAKALIVDALMKIERARTKLASGNYETSRVYLQQYIKDTEEYIQQTLAAYGRGGVASLEMRKRFEEQAAALVGETKETKKDTKKEDTKELADFDAINRELAERLAAFEWTLTEMRIKAEADRIAKLRNAKIAFINETTDYETYALALKNAKGEITEQEYQDAIFQIKLKGLKEQLALLDVQSDAYRAMLNSITELERNRMLALAKMQADAAKAQADAAKNSMDAFKQQVDEIKNVVSSYTDLIFKVLQLGNAEKKRNEQWDEQLDKELAKNDKLTQAKARLAKTDAERNKILSKGEKDRENMFEANEAKQKKYAEEGSQMSEQQKAQSLINAAAGMVVAVVNIIQGLTATGPFALALIPPAIAGALAMYDSMKSSLGFKDGGFIEGKGHPDGTDTVPAYLDKGEFVLRKEAVEKIGKAKLYAMNAIGEIPKFSTGGMLDDLWDESLRIGRFQNASNAGRQNTFTVSSSTIAENTRSNKQIMGAINTQTDRMVTALEKKSFVLNSQRMLLTNKVAQRSRNRETV